MKSQLKKQIEFNNSLLRLQSSDDWATLQRFLDARIEQCQPHPRRVQDANHAIALASELTYCQALKDLKNDLASVATATEKLMLRYESQNQKGTDE